MAVQLHKSVYFNLLCCLSIILLTSLYLLYILMWIRLPNIYSLKKKSRVLFTHEILL